MYAQACAADSIIIMKLCISEDKRESKSLMFNEQISLTYVQQFKTYKLTVQIMCYYLGHNKDGLSLHLDAQQKDWYVIYNYYPVSHSSYI